MTVTLVGACGTCPASTDTLKAGIERIMRDRVDGVTEVVACAAPTAGAAPLRNVILRRLLTPPGRAIVARWPACCRSSSAGRGARAVGRLAYPLGGGRTPSASPARPGRQVDAHERHHRPPPRRGERGDGAGHRPVLTVHRRRHPRRPGAHAGPRHRSGRVHPVDGDAWPPRRPGPRRARGHPAARRGRRAAVIVETVGVGQVEVEIAGEGRHHRRGREPGLGRRRAGQQGRPDGDRPTSSSSTRPTARASTRPAATSSRCSTCPIWGTGAADPATVGHAGEGAGELWQAVLDHRPLRETGVLEDAASGAAATSSRTSSSAASMSAPVTCARGDLRGAGGRRPRPASRSVVGGRRLLARLGLSTRNSRPHGRRTRAGPPRTT